MKAKEVIAFAAMVLGSVNLLAQTSYQFPPVSELPVVETLPDPFTFFGSDKKVSTQEDWEERREEIKALIQHYEYGQGFPLPYNTVGKVTSSNPRFEGKATYYEADLAMGPSHSVTANIQYIVPAAKEGPLPVLVLTSYLPDRTTITSDWIENVIDRGYIVAEFFVLQINPYNSGERTPGQVAQAYPDYDGSVLQEWSWGCSGVITYLSSLDFVDTERIIVSGNSRRGKTALLTGVMDDRVDLTVVSCSGCQGMPVFRYYGKNACTLKKPATIFPGWSNDRFKDFIDKETLLPFDQHFMAAAIAPRALLVVEGSTDNNANQEGSQESYTASKVVYEWLGVPENIGWYEHIGGHGYFEDDVYATLDFADMVFGGKTPESGQEFDRLVYPQQKHLVNWTAPENRIQ